MDSCENIKSLYLQLYVPRGNVKSSVCLHFYALGSVFLPVSRHETLFSWVPVSEVVNHDLVVADAFFTTWVVSR